MSFLNKLAASATKAVDGVKAKIDEKTGKKGKSRGGNTSNRAPPNAAFNANAAKACPSTVRMFSGCCDEQTSADVQDVASFGLPPASPQESAGGACTNALLSIIKKRPDITFGDLLMEMQTELKRRKYTQVPQLSSSNQVNLKEEKFELKSPKPTGRTRAVLIGINYFGQKGELNGCVNDVKMMKDFVVSQGFSDSFENMRILTDDKAFTHGEPTGDNILAAMQWLVEGAVAGDSLFFHYSGHGGQMEDQDGDEEDGMDETLIPVDYMTEGQIRDDTIYQIMCSRLAKDVHLICVFDCCHSGTILDLPFIFTANDEGCSAIGSGQQTQMGGNNFFNFDAAIKLAGEAAKGILRGLTGAAEKGRGMLSASKKK